jgi:DNA-binding NtrC family response regulator
VRRQPYELIISDIRMADGSGEEFYRTAVTENPTLAPRFVFVTGDTANTAAWAFLKTADVTVLEKPFRPEVFLDLVRRVVSGAASSPD